MAEPSFAVPASFRPTFTAAGTVRRGLALLFQRPLIYVGFTATQTLPVLFCLGLLYVVLGPEGWDQVGDTADYPGWFWPIYVPSCLAIVVAYGASLHTAAEQLAGRRVAFGAALAVGARRFIPLFAVTLAMAAVSMLNLVGLILCTIYIVAMPIAVQERRGFWGALRHAAHLSRGYRVTLFAIGVCYLALAAALYVASLLVAFLVGMIPGVTSDGPVATAMVVVSVASLLLAVAILFPPLLAATYVGLREEKDGGTPEQVAGVFT